MNFSIIVTDKVARPDVDAPIIVCGNSDYVIDFVFDNEWEEYEIKNAIFTFKRGGQKKAIEVVFTGTQCAVPILSGIDEVWIGVYAGELHTTTPARFACKKSAVCDVARMEDPPTDVYNQLLEVLKNNFPIEAGLAAREAADYAYQQIEAARSLMEQEIENMYATLADKIDRQYVLDMVNGVTVWENPDVTVSFEAQTIDLDLSQYNRFAVIYLERTSLSARRSEVNVYEKDVYYTVTIADPTTNYGGVEARYVKISDNSIQFSDSSSSNGYLIPLKVMAYKYYANLEYVPSIEHSLNEVIEEQEQYINGNVE